MHFAWTELYFILHPSQTVWSPFYFQALADTWHLEVSPRNAKYGAKLRSAKLEQGCMGAEQYIGHHHACNYLAEPFACSQNWRFGLFRGVVMIPATRKQMSAGQETY